MANQANQKLKLLYIMDYFRMHTDEEHPASATDLIHYLEANDITAERKSIYRDIQVLMEYGMDIEKSSDNAGYYLASREFELAELKLLVDAVAASKFISEKKSRELVGKIEGLGSEFQAKHLHRQVVVSDRVKNSNESIYYAIDEIYKCIDDGKKITFQYMDWNEKKEQVLRHDGKWYVVSPEFLLWDNEYYYLVAYDDGAGEIRHYRVDKIRNAVEMDENRVRREEEIKKGDYAKKRFGMFSGQAEMVSLQVPVEMTGIMIDRFGTEIPVRKDGDFIIARLSVEVSPQFFGWLAGLGPKVKIISPESLQKKYKEYLYAIYLG